MKFSGCLLAAALLVVPAYSQNTNTFPSPQGSPDLKVKWFQEMPTDADVINEGKDVNRIGRDIIIKDGAESVSVVDGRCFVLGTVNGSVSVVNGSATILGKVNGSVSVVAGDIRVAGEVMGACSVVGGRVIKAPGAKIHGATSEVAMNGLVEKLVNQFAGPRQKNHHHGGYCPMSSLAGCSHFFLVWRLIAGIALIFISLLLALIWPEHFSQAAGELGTGALRYFAVGFLFWIAFWVLLAIALIASIILIGIPFLGALLLLNLAIKWYGFTVLFAWIGHLIVRKLCRIEAHEAACVLTGGVVLLVLFLIPCLGFLLYFLAAKLAAGAAIFGVFRKRTSVFPDPQTP